MRKKEVELERVRMAIRDNIVTPEVESRRLRRRRCVTASEESIDQIALVHTFKAKPKPEDIFDGSFLPPAAERKVHRILNRASPRVDGPARRAADSDGQRDCRTLAATALPREA